VPGEAAAATLAAVRRALSDGADPVVASPRPSAAALVLLRLGPALGPEISRLGRQNGCDELVLCVEPGWPFVAGRPRSGTARALAAALKGAKRSELVVSGSPEKWGDDLALVARLSRAVPCLTTSSPALAAALSSARGSRGGPAEGRTIVPAVLPGFGSGPGPGSGPGSGPGHGQSPGSSPGSGPGAAGGNGTAGSPGQGVGPLEPGELLLATRARRLAGRWSRRIFGRSEPQVRALVASLVRPARPLLSRVRGLKAKGPASP